MKGNEDKKKGRYRGSRERGYVRIERGRKQSTLQEGEKEDKTIRKQLIKEAKPQ
jgi:hypothetical protein